MTEQVDRLIDETLSLAPDEGSAVALMLLDRQEGDDSVTEAWATEIRKRKSELRSGAVRAVPWGRARARLNALSLTDLARLKYGLCLRFFSPGS